MRMMLNDDDDDDDNMSLHVFPILTAVLGSRGVSVEEIDRLPRKNKYKKKYHNPFSHLDYLRKG